VAEAAPQYRQHLGAEPGDVLHRPVRVAGALGHAQQVPDPGGLDGGGHRLGAVAGGSDRVDPAQQIGVGVQVTGGPRAAVHRPVPRQARPQPARQLPAQQPLSLLTAVCDMGAAELRRQQQHTDAYPRWRHGQLTWGHGRLR
jgi:hypothetical protein